MAYMTDENGNYKRTVRCGYCYEKGHNKSACPKRKTDLQENIKRYAKELAEEGWPADDYRRKNAERYLRHSKDQLHKMETRGQNRKCGFCGEPGHTRRTCTERKRQVKERLAEVLDIRKRTAQRMMDAGFGPGALISVDHNLQGQDAVMAVVTEVRFDDIRKSHVPSRHDYFNGAHGIRYQYLVPKEDRWGGSPRTHGNCYFPVQYLNVDDIPEGEWYRNPSNDSCQLISPVSVSEDNLLTEDTIGVKAVTKWVIDNIVDPK